MWRRVGWVVGLLFGLVAAAPAPAQTALKPLPIVTTLIKDQDFRELPKSLMTSASPNGKEVIVFFYYNSPWSAQIVPYLKAWEAEGDPDIRFTWSPAVLGDSWAYGARVFFALDLLGKNPELTEKLIEAYAKHVVTYGDTASLETWLSGQGVSREAFEKAIDDPKVIARATWVPPVMNLYTVHTVPTLVINGKYVVEATGDDDAATVVAKARYIVAHIGPAPTDP